MQYNSTIILKIDFDMKLKKLKSGVLINGFKVK
jgi:hypothetical protein